MAIKCGNGERQWCHGLSGLTLVLGLVVTLCGMFVAIQERRIVQLEDKNDTIVEMKTDLRYMKNDISDIKVMLKDK